MTESATGNAATPTDGDPTMLRETETETETDAPTGRTIGRRQALLGLGAAVVTVAAAACEPGGGGTSTTTTTAPPGDRKSVV